MTCILMYLGRRVPVSAIYFAMHQKKKKKETKNKMERKAGLMDGGVNYVIEQVEYNVV